MPVNENKGLFFVGLGCGSWDSISLRGWQLLQSADVIYADGYTNFFGKDILEIIEDKLGKAIQRLDRNALENEQSELVKRAKVSKIVLLVSGDPFSATTHLSIRLLAKKNSVPVEICHNASIFTVAASRIGLFSYKFGRTATIPFPENNSRYPYDVAEQNQNNGNHTLFLLDINVNEDRFLSVSDALTQLIQHEKLFTKGIITIDSTFVGIAHACAPRERVIVGNIKRISIAKWNEWGPPQSLILCGSLHFAEKEALEVLW